MNNFTIILLALAVALTVFPSCLMGGVVLSSEKLGNKLRFIAIMSSTMIVMAALGVILGLNVGRISESSNRIMSLSILMVIGLKVLLDSLRTRPQDKAFDTSDLKVLVLLSLAEAIVPMAVAMAVGLLVESFLWPWLIFVFFIVPAVSVGFFLGGKMGVQSYKMRTGPIGGLFLIASSIIMIIDLIGY